MNQTGGGGGSMDAVNEILSRNNSVTPPRPLGVPANNTGADNFERSSKRIKPNTPGDAGGGLMQISPLKSDVSSGGQQQPAAAPPGPPPKLGDDDDEL